MKLILLGLLLFSGLLVRDAVAEISCPTPPVQLNKDLKVEVELAIGKIGRLAAGNASAEVERTTRDLLGKLPRADELYLEQMLFAAICSSIRDDNAITDSEKTSRLLRYREAVSRGAGRSTPQQNTAASPKPRVRPPSAESQSTKEDAQRTGPARQTLIATTFSLPRTAIPMYGPSGGELKHNPSSGYVVWHPTGVSLTNLIADATFINPYSSLDHRWGAVVFFRKGLRLWVQSNNQWGSGHFSGTEWITSNAGKLPDKLLNNDKGAKNRLTIVATGGIGCLFVNGKFAASLDLSAVVASGDVAIGISDSINQQPDAVTKFSDFSVYAIPKSDDCIQ